MTALIRLALLAGAALAPHVALEFVDRRPLRPPDDIQRDRLVGLAAEALHLEVSAGGVERVAERRGRLGRPRKASMRAFHAWQANMSASRRASAACSARCLTVDPNMYSRDLDPIPNDRADPRGWEAARTIGQPAPAYNDLVNGRRLWRENRAEQRISSSP